MTTEEIASRLSLMAKLMELHAENPFKVKSLTNAAYRLDKTGIDLNGLTLQQLEAIEGIGKSIAQKIHELQTTGKLSELELLLAKTPAGLIDILQVKGIGPKKVAQLWQELSIESVGELVYACKENRLVELKGFGVKTQEQILKNIEFKISNNGKFHYASIEKFAQQLENELKQKLNTSLVALTGSVRRKSEIIEHIDLVAASSTPIDTATLENPFAIPINLYSCTPADFHKKLFETTATSAHLTQLAYNSLTINEPASEQAIYSALKHQYVEPELREGHTEVALAKENKLPELVKLTDLKGILHNHSTYSDGLHTLKDMALYCKALGYEYLGICDHSQSAFYANGLKPERVLAQHQEIDLLNKELAPFKIFKGIESDILNDGSLDYPKEILQSFDFIVASVHSNLKMSEEKATERLLKAIENPYTTILGHPTGRLLLSREGYPIDHKKIIDACAANKVIIELNAHPYRLDIDWRWIPYCLEKGVKISINPDAHEKEGYHDMYYGLCAARKGMLTASMTFNALNQIEIQNYFKARKENI